MDKRALNFLKRHGLASKIYRPLPISGSGRKFYRFHDPPCILMQTPLLSDRAHRHPAEHILGCTDHQEATQRWLDRHHQLTQGGIPVPRVIDADAKAGCILIQDLGDQTLEQRLRTCAPDKVPAVLSEAIQLLICCQHRFQSVRLPSYPDGLWEWELQHFWQWMIEDLGIEHSDADKEAFAQLCKALMVDIEGGPKGFCHRDFQSRNLMWYQEQLWLIDFQDLCEGPLSYDWVGLLLDAYTNLSDELKEQGLSTLLDNVSTVQESRRALARQFRATAVHRSLKDAGRFRYFVRVRGLDHYQIFIRPVLGQAIDALRAWSPSSHVTQQMAGFIENVSKSLLRAGLNSAT